jgi:hypothetical protein
MKKWITRLGWPEPVWDGRCKLALNPPPFSLKSRELTPDRGEHGAHFLGLGDILAVL